MSAQPGLIQRRATPIESTSEVLPGTMVTVPASAGTGPSPVGATGSVAPVVAVNSVHWFKDPAFLAAAGGALLAIADPVVEALTSTRPFNWRSLVAACILALVAFFRNRSNSILK